MLTGFATQKVLGLFCYLLENKNQSSGREKLMSIFWGESPENQARYNLRYALWNIRKLFKESEKDIDPLICNRVDCQVSPDLPLIIDTYEFSAILADKEERAETHTAGTEESHRGILYQTTANRAEGLERAVEMYKGPFLDGFTVRNLPEWEEWLYHRREALHQDFLNAAVELGNYYLVTDQAERSMTVFMRALSLAPDLDPAHEGLIRAYADQGRSAAAMRQYNAYTKVMEREYNAPPGIEITELIEKLRSGTYVRSYPKAIAHREAQSIDIIESDNQTDQNLSTEGVAIQEEILKQTESQVQNGEPHTLTETGYKEESFFIGRDQELNDLKQIIEEVKSGRGQVLIISGEMGIGKTTLFQKLLHKVPDSFFIGIGEAQEISASRPLEGLMQVLESFEKDDRLSEEQKAKLKELFDMERTVGDQLENSTEIHLLEAIRRWIISLSKKAPVLMAIDDLHWANEATLSVFASLAQDAKRLPLLIVGIFRTFELQSEDVIASSLISIARTGRLRRIELENLSTDETIQLISNKTAKVGDQIVMEDIKQLCKFSCGIPLFAVELANFIEDGRLDILQSPKLLDRPDFTSDNVQDVVPPLMLKIANLRLSQFSKLHVELLKSASLILSDFSLKLIQSLIGGEEDVLEDALVDLEHRNVLHHVEKGDDLVFAFNHQMIKLAFIETIPSLERRRFYKKIVKTIKEVNEDCSTDAMAYYLYNAGERTDAIPYLLSSSRLWFGYGDKQVGLRYSKVAFEVAMEKFSDKPEQMVKVLLEHGDNLLHHGLVKAAIDVYTDAIGKLEAQDDKGEQASILSRREEMKALLKKEPDKKKADLSPLALVITKRALANVKLTIGDNTGAEKHLSEAEKLLDKLPDMDLTHREAGMLFQVKAKLHIYNKEYSDAIIILNNSLELLKHNGIDSEVSESYLLIGHAYRLLEKYDKAEEALQNCFDISGSEDDPTIMVHYYHERGILLLKLKEFNEAEQHLQQALELSRGNTFLSSELLSITRDFASVVAAQGKIDIAQKLFKIIDLSTDDKIDTTDIAKLSELLDELGVGE
ncbi:MAG: AAA family ATPase [Candidatus Hatepunaea meridiana]|nr:AAA family ATPase [Candidatus Hatepunaea meridiana]